MYHPFFARFNSAASDWLLVCSWAQNVNNNKEKEIKELFCLQNGAVSKSEPCQWFPVQLPLRRLLLQDPAPAELDPAQAPTQDPRGEEVRLQRVQLSGSKWWTGMRRLYNRVCFVLLEDTRDTYMD